MNLVTANLPLLLLGVVLLLFGRRLFWLFVAVMGMILGYTLATQFFGSQSTGLTVLLVIAGAVIGAVLAVFLQRLAVGLAGFLAGGYLLVNLLAIFGWQNPALNWVPFLIGGILGAILVAVLFDWALIILTSLTGAGLVVQAFQAGEQAALVIFLVLTIIGVVVQAGLFRRRLKV